MVVVEIHDQRLILKCVYGYNNHTNNRAMMDRLGILVNEWKTKFVTEKVTLGGDLNEAPNSWMDRIPHRSSQPEYDETLSNLCATTNTVDY